MQSNFGNSCQAARTRISVPTIPLASIRTAAEARSHSGRAKPWLRPLAAAFASVSVVASAAGAAVWSTHVSLTKAGTVILTGDSVHTTRHPTSADLHSAAYRVDFPVVLPQGLPSDTKLSGLTRIGTSALVLTYDLPGAARRNNHLLGVVLASPASTTAVSNDARVKPMSHRDYTLNLGHAREHWSVGAQDVLVLPPSTMTFAEIARMKQAMHARTRTP